MGLERLGVAFSHACIKAGEMLPSPLLCIKPCVTLVVHSLSVPWTVMGLTLRNQEVANHSNTLRSRCGIDSNVKIHRD
jgi:hypothetical protein